MTEKTKLNAITNPYRAADAIRNWLKAYPESVFPELSEKEWKKFHETLTEAGLSSDRVGASCMRHVLNGLHGYLEPILDAVGALEDFEHDEYNKLLREWEKRERIIGANTVLHPSQLKRIVAELDEAGTSEAADAIQALVWECVILGARAERLKEQKKRND